MEIDRLATLDLHTAQIQGFTLLPFDNLYLASTLLEYFRDLPWKTDVVLVASDTGGVARVRAIAKRLGCKIAFIDKRREGPNESEVMHVVGEVTDKIAVMVDDMIDTAGSLVLGAQAIKDKGAIKIYAVATHGVLSRNPNPQKDSIERLKKSIIETIVISDSLLIPPEKQFDRLKIVSCAPLVAEMIRRVHNREPVSPLFEEAFRWVK
jgi:ribose-phosphate pyrophosphokinase